MKKVKILVMFAIFMLPFVLMAATGDTETVKDQSLIMKWITGAGVTLLGGLVVWAKKNFTKVTKTIKEILDIPLAVTTGLSKISTEIAQASGSVTNMLQMMESFAQDDSMSAKELIAKFKVQKDIVIQELKDIPKAVDEAAVNIRKEINDLMKSKDE